MKRVLYIAYFFPPLGGAGVQRTLKFVRYLPQWGWEATVLTARAPYWMLDPSLSAELPPSTRILRAPFWGGRVVGMAAGGKRPAERSAPADGTPSSSAREEVSRSSETSAVAGKRSDRRIRILRWIARGVLVPDAYLGWAYPALREARRELAMSRYDAVLTTSSPDSTHLVGRTLKRSLGVPWVADFRDPWTRRLAYRPFSPWHDRLHRNLERSCLKEADRVIVTTEETRRDFLTLYPGIPAGKIEVIPNGFDEDDFRAAAASCKAAGLSPVLSASDPTPRFSIVHAGQLNPERPLAPFLAGLRFFLDRFPAREEDVRTLFLGGYYDRDLAEVRRFGLEGVVTFLSGRPHIESIATLLRSRILLLLEHDSDRGRLVLPGKVFEYLRSGRPILAVVPTEGAAARVVRQFKAGFVADPASADSVAEGIETLLARTPHVSFDQVSSDRVPSDPLSGDAAAPGASVSVNASQKPRDLPSNELRAFDRPELARRLAGVLDSMG